MLTIFRKIRNSMLKSGNTQRYLLYAIGEIALVVIGILVALQINNWNQNRIDRQKEENYLVNLKRDFNDQIQSIDDQIEAERSYAESAFPILQSYYDGDPISFDSTMAQNLSLLVTRRTFVRTDPTFSELISSGNIDLLKDLHFKDALIRYFQDLKRKESIVEKNNVYLTDQMVGNILTKLGYIQDYRILNPDSKLKQFSNTSNKHLMIISQKLLSDEKNELAFINAVNLKNDVAIFHINLMEELKQQTIKMIEMINEL